MEGTLSTGGNAVDLIQSLTKKERVKTGRHWVSNSDKAWYKPWTWFQEKGWYVDDYEDREYVEGQELAQRFLAGLQERLDENMQSATNYAGQQAKTIQEAFKKKFKELDEALQKKLNELTAYSKDQTDTERAIKESEERLHWLEEIRRRVDAILEI